MSLIRPTEPVIIDSNRPVLEQQAAIVSSFINSVGVDEFDKLLRRHKARNSLLDFTLYTKPNYHVNWHHELLCTELDDFLASPTRNRLMIFVGPRRGKSEIVSRRLPAYAFGKNPDLNVISCSYAADLAVKMSRDTQRIMDSDTYRELFPRTKLNSKNIKTTSKGSYIRTSDKFEIVDFSGSYRAAGVGGGITGQGADLAIIDDPIKDWADALSPVKKQAVYDWYVSTFYTRLSKNGKVILLMTRWAEDDLAGRLLADAKKDPDSDQWEVISLPELYDSDNEHVHPLDPRSDGEILWPEFFPEAKVRSIRSTVGTKVWTSLFQQQPKPSDGTVFKASWFKYYKELPQMDRYVVSWDMNFGNNTETADYVVGGVWGIKGANKYLVYLVRERLDFISALSEFVRVETMYPGKSYALVEGKANGPAIVSSVKDKVAGVVVFMPDSSKAARAIAVSPQFESGNIFLPDPYYKPNRDNFPWMDVVQASGINLLNAFIEEFKAFPYGSNDDMVDMTVQMLLRESNVPAWLANIEAATKEETQASTGAFDQAVAKLFGWENKIETVSENGVPRYRLGF